MTYPIVRRRSEAQPHLSNGHQNPGVSTGCTPLQIFCWFLRCLFLAQHLQSKLFTGGSSGVNSPQVDLKLSRNSHDHFFLLPRRDFAPCSFHFIPPLFKPFILWLVSNDAPGCLNEQPPEPRISVFVDASLKAAPAAGVFPRAEACVTSHLAAV